MTPTNTEALRLADAIECSEPFTLIDKACNEAAAELRRLAAVEAERDKFASESAQHFIRGREWAERAGQMEAERDALRADAERWRRLYRRAINEANGLTNYVEERPELRRAERQLEAIQLEARAIDAAMKGTQ